MKRTILALLCISIVFLLSINTLLYPIQTVQSYQEPQNISQDDASNTNQTLFMDIRQNTSKIPTIRNNSQKFPRIDLSQYQDHAAISIDGDLDFDSQASNEGWSGNGSIDAPYIIANMSFNQGDRIGDVSVMISIQNTNYYFKITNNYINSELDSDIGYRVGISLQSVRNCQVINNTIHATTGGVLIQQAEGCLVSNNTMVSNSYPGDPRADNPSDPYAPGGRYPYGVGFRDSSKGNITHNSISFNGVGIIVEF
ncbi:MAG: NosD domain-containing protein, partial [Candidatus Kariarchaeaceae archaeon]